MSKAILRILAVVTLTACVSLAFGPSVWRWAFPPPEPEMLNGWTEDQWLEAERAFKALIEAAYNK